MPVRVHMYVEPDNQDFIADPGVAFSPPEAPLSVPRQKLEARRGLTWRVMNVARYYLKGAHV